MTSENPAEVKIYDVPACLSLKVALLFPAG
jgi:hypothetical protein